MNVSIKNVDEDTWAEFKANAAENKMTMSEYLEKLLEDAEEADSNWTEILYGKKCLDDETAEDILEKSKELRKSFEMRDIEWD